MWNYKSLRKRTVAHKHTKEFYSILMGKTCANYAQQIQPDFIY